MTRFPIEPGDDRNEETGEPADLGEGASDVATAGVRKSGVRRREERSLPDLGSSPAPTAPAAAEAPCRTFDEVYARYKREVWETIRSWGVVGSEADDVFQKIFQDLSTRIREHGVPEGVAPLLFTMTQRKVISHLRARGVYNKRFDGEPDADTMPSSKPGPEQLFERAEARQRVEDILARMPADAALVFRLLEIDELPYPQVAEHLDRSVETLRVQLHRARARFWDLAARLYDVYPENSA